MEPRTMICTTGPVTDAEIAEADLKAYSAAMLSPTGWRACLAIEEAWELDGYPPAVVTEVLHAVATGGNADDALEAALSR
jgi:hypothetical protein